MVINSKVILILPIIDLYFLLILKSFLYSNMQDILDSGFDMLGLSAMPNSRSASMKKINKKQNNSPSRVDNNHSIMSRGSFDLASSSINKQSKHFINTTKRINHDAFDFGLGDFSSPKGSPKGSKYQDKSIERNSFGNTVSQFDVLGEDHGINHHFGNTQKSIVNPSKVNDSFVSSRNMKPPLRPKDNWNSSLNFGGNSAGITIPEQDPTLTNSSNGFNRSNSLRKRSSIDGRSQLSDDVFPLNNNRTNGAGSINSFNSFHQDAVKQDFLSNIHKSESCVIPSQPKNDSQSSSNFFQARGKLQSKSQSLKVGQQEQKKPCVNCEKNKINEKEISSYYQRQIDMLKNTYQKQIEYLQECLDKQIGQNRALRAKFLEEANKMIQQQRGRNSKIHQQQVNRLKQIFEWQQKKQEDAYQMEIASLKTSLGLAAQHRDWVKDNQKPSGYNLQLLQNQLQTKQLRLQSKIRTIEQRQLQLDTRQSELSLRMRREDDKIRNEEKRIMEMQADFKKRMLEQKKYLSSEKQQLAMESGNMQSQLMKAKEDLMISQKQVQLQRQALEQDRHTLQMLNQQSMQKHKINLEQIQREKERLNELQVELVKKMRIVEMRAKQLSYQCNNHQELPSRKHNNNWLDNSFSKGSELKQKKLHGSNSMSSLHKTKQRFYNLESNVKTRLNLSTKENKKIDLSGYITRMENNKYKHA